MRSRLDGEVYDAVFRLVLGIVESKGLLRGKVAGVDSTYLRADASMKTIVRKDAGPTTTTDCNLKKLCEEPRAREPDRRRRAPNGSEARGEEDVEQGVGVADGRRRTKFSCVSKDGRTRLGYKAEHVVDLDTGAIVSAELYGADESEYRDGSVRAWKADPRERRSHVRSECESDDSRDDDDDEPPPAAPTDESREIIEVVADKGYHKVESLLELRRAEYRTYHSGSRTEGRTRHLRR
jgi:transposase